MYQCIRSMLWYFLRAHISEAAKVSVGFCMHSESLRAGHALISVSRPCKVEHKRIRHLEPKSEILTSPSRVKRICNDMRVSEQIVLHGVLGILQAMLIASRRISFSKTTCRQRSTHISRLDIAMLDAMVEKVAQPQEDLSHNDGENLPSQQYEQASA